MAEGDRWSVCPVGAGLLIELDGQVVSMSTDQRHARYLVGCANSFERGAFQLMMADADADADADGDRLDAERRGYVVQPEDMMCPNCSHHSVAHTADGCGFDGCECKRSWSDLRG